MALAQVAFHAAQADGVTSLNLVEHTMTPKLEDSFAQCVCLSHYAGFFHRLS